MVSPNALVHALLDDMFGRAQLQPANGLQTFQQGECMSCGKVYDDILEKDKSSQTRGISVLQATLMN